MVLNQTPLAGPRARVVHGPAAPDPMDGPRSQQSPVLQRCQKFVGRTVNWLYDHLRLLPGYRPIILCDHLENRDEFPELDAWKLPRDRLDWRLWHRLAGARPYPPYLYRLQSLGATALHSHFGHVALGDLELGRRLDCPWVISFYGADVYRLRREPRWVARYQEVFQECARVLALGPEMARALAELGCDADKIAVHPLGVNTEEIPSLPRHRQPGEPLRVLFAGTFREKKGIEYVVRGAHLARRSGVELELHLVGDAAPFPGDAETKAGILRLVQDLEMSGVTTHHSWLPFNELVDLALRSHVFVAPSVTARNGDSEGTPFVIQQMMATGMPVVSTRHSDIPFIFGEHADLLVPERDAEKIADRLREYWDDPARMEEVGIALRTRVREALDIRARARALSEQYEALS